MTPAFVLARRTFRDYCESPAAAAALFAYYLLAGYLFAAPLFAYGQASLRPLLEVAPLLLTFLVPALTMGLVAAELSAGTFETLVSFPLEDRDVVAGKYLGFAAFYTAATAALLLFAVSARALAAPPAGLDWGEALGSLAALWAQGLALGAAGVFASSLGRSQLGAFALSAGTGFFFLAASKAAPYAPPALGAALERIALEPRMAALARGVLDSRDVLYFLTAILSFLYLAVLRLEARRARLGRTLAFSAAGALLAAASLAVLNAAGAYAWTRLDLSANRAYSLSPASKEAVAALEEPLIVRVYFTSALPPAYASNERYLRDLLAEYRASSRGRLTVEWKDPSASAELEREAKAAGVEAVQVNVLSRGQFNAREAYMGALLLYKGEKQALPVIGSTADLEYDLTRRITRLTRPERKIAAFVAGHGERDPGDRALAPFYELLREQVRLAAANLEKDFVADVSAAWIVDPSMPFKPAELERLRSWVRGGGSVGILLNRRALDFERYSSAPRDLGLEKLLAEWGVTETDALVADAQSDRIEVQSRMGAYLTTSVRDYPLIPVVTRFSRTHPAVRGLDATPFPFVHALELGTPPAGVSATVLAESSPNSVLREARSIAPDESLEDAKGRRGPFPLAVALEGPFAPGAKPARVVIVATGRQVDPRFVNRSASVDFLMNLIEWSLREEALLAVRSKGPSYRPLRPLPDARSRALIRVALAASLPLATLACALVFAREKRRRRAENARRYARA